MEVLRHRVLDALYDIMRTKYDITRDELPYRIETLYRILETTFDLRGAKTVGTHIAQKFYTKLGLTFHKHDCYTLLDYIEEAKAKLAK